MRKIAKLLLTFMAGIVITLVGIGLSSLPNEINNSPVNEETVLTSSTSLKTDSQIFTEEKTDGLASYLKVQIPESSSLIKSIKIIQTIGSTSRVLTEDEKGSACYYKSTDLGTKNTLFYFTRPATYTVIYITQSNTRVQETCKFAPELNEDIIKTLQTTTGSGSTQTKSPIIQAGDQLILTTAGNIELPIDDHNLYSISATTTSLANEKLAAPDLLNTIPENSFGTITYTITSTNGNCNLNLNVIVLTTNFSIDFEDLNNNSINKENYAYPTMDGYVFNESVNAKITVDATAKNLIGETLNDNTKLTALDYLDFNLVEVERNATNTENGESLSTPIPNPTISPEVKLTLEERDHSIYSFKTTIANAQTGVEYVNNLPRVKIITKVPINTNGKTVFSVIPNQGDNKEESNYITGILNNYVKKDSIVYYPMQGVRVYFNKDAFASTGLDYKFNGSNGTITTSTDFLRINSPGGVANLQISSKTENFDQFYTFTFITKNYAVENKSFHSTMLSGQMKYSVSIDQSSFFNVSDNFNDSFHSITVPITAFKYITPNNYEENCIPMYIRVTHNGTTYDNIHEFKNSDQLLFTARGEYSIEFYNLPSYDYIESNLSNWNASGATASINFYYKLSFTITGPSIKVSTTNSSGENLTISNNMYTQSPVTCNVSLTDGQTFIVYKNGNEHTRKTTSMEFNLSTPATWKISIVNAEGSVLNQLTFTIADTIYQGFTINEQPEYLSLKVSKRISSLPITYSEFEHETAYHLTQSGVYKIEIDALESLPFTLINNEYVLGTKLYAHTINSNTFEINITKSFFNFSFATGKNGDRITDSVVISMVDGVQLQTLQVYKNNTLVKEFTADELAKWEEIVETSKTFGDNGRYTFRMVDKFGNTYETQIEKYYKVNVALVLLIILIVALIVVLIFIIIKTRHKVSVK